MGVYTTGNIADTFEDIPIAQQLLLYIYSDDKDIHGFDHMVKYGYLIIVICVVRISDCEQMLLDFLDVAPLHTMREHADCSNVSGLRKVSRILELGKEKSGKRLTKGEVEAGLNTRWNDGGVQGVVASSGEDKSRSRAKIIKINNPGNGKNVWQVQISPGGGRHGKDPYGKISTTDQGILEIIDGSPKDYMTDGKEKAILIFTKE